MAIFDSEKRPRGLRVPSLTAMKNGTAAARSQFSFSSKKSNESRTPEEDPISTPPSGGFFAPLPKAAPPPSKELPAIPRDQLPPPPRITTKVPARREVGSNARPSETSPTTQGLRRPAPPIVETAPLPEPQPELQQTPQMQPSPPMKSERRMQPEPTISQSQMQPRPQEQFQSHFTRSQPPVTLSPPAAEDNEDVTPLEDFIPTPDGSGTPLEPVSSSEQARTDTPPLEFAPVAAALNKVHLACFQEHRNMPVAQNVWCPIPCMTCLKFDREIRHRCVFCCLRICEGCHQVLMKCKNRSLEELVGSLH
ncbi:hypothetical protein N7448_008255 [Penicillium atrosanguineum]|uniref:Uncharacterized protein n=1 Tax=Penicillium atrosanguineum TaxID=1132637 RepID=A0A9W9GR92_9EURO|nr:uncharacterized protein N7443_000731 [Penicillium atrosanguineum]KAJ5127476.1 hypothetical protein N7448_008255 [Penicillium atrosanguineum]KAJ5147680.1 hypothetical protein N7526_001032 [Penicillium atrosanguineum]KAJ5313847.1 hypothetical protein N7443_000731 [Penicillium atrosanguineum]KAJ5331018.1 hypothetical protein N7476_000801 [Penicillium atrosanguineum]